VALRLRRRRESTASPAGTVSLRQQHASSPTRR
jgi:hypothetical protein